ncbi:MAG TPA: hypothetical protein VFE62_14490, partial [Gemmataceae bacterium]|nr:hypothetical protein [Gemmataceae bacterium]
TYEIAKNAKVIVHEGRERKDGKLADLQPRMRVRLNLDDAKKVVQSIETFAREADRPRESAVLLRGMVSDIDVAKNKITFTSPRRGEPDLTETYDLAKGVKVYTRTGRTTKEAKLADVQPKIYVVAKLDDAKKIVQTIEISISTTRFGMVSEITADSITLVVPRRGEAQQEGTKYTLGKSVKVQYRTPGGGNGREVSKITACKIGDVAEKAIVNLQLDDTLMTVEVIELQLPMMQGSVQSIDAKKFTLLLRPGRGDDIQFDISKDAKIMVDGKAGNLDGIAVGAEVHVILAPDRSRVLYLQTPLPKGREE